MPTGLVLGFNNGLIICHGVVMAQNATIQQTTTLPISFTSINFVLVTNLRGNAFDPYANICITRNVFASYNQFRWIVYQYTMPVTIEYICIGH